jgi:phage-related tail fiber protein
MTLRLNGSTSGFVELDAPAVADGQRYQVPDDLGVPAGAVLPFAGNVAPAGWLKANGAVISRATYPKLWAYAQVSGNLAASEGAKQAGQFGPGNGSSTFSIPDLRAEFVRGWDDGRGVDTGRTIGSTQADELKSHFHLNPTTSGSAGSYEVGTGSTGYDYGDQSAPTSSTGGSETRPRNVALLYCIKH